MANRPCGTSRNVLSTLLTGALAHVAYPSITGMVFRRWLSDLGTISALYPLFSMAVGLFVGYRIPRYGWAYAAVPIIAVTVLTVSISPGTSRHIWLGYELPVGVLGGVIGGFIGSKLVTSGDFDKPDS